MDDSNQVILIDPMCTTRNMEMDAVKEEEDLINLLNNNLSIKKADDQQPKTFSSRSEKRFFGRGNSKPFYKYQKSFINVEENGYTFANMCATNNSLSFSFSSLQSFTPSSGASSFTHSSKSSSFAPASGASFFNPFTPASGASFFNPLTPASRASFFNPLTVPFPGASFFNTLTVPFPGTSVFNLPAPSSEALFSHSAVPFPEASFFRHLSLPSSEVSFAPPLSLPSSETPRFQSTESFPSPAHATRVIYDSDHPSPLWR